MIPGSEQKETFGNGLGVRQRRSIVSDLQLTALIDAFSILLIFLLMSFSSTGEILYVGKGIELPKASQAESLERKTVVKVEQEKIFIEEKEVPKGALVEKLIEVRKALARMAVGDKEEDAAITVQADRRLKYDFLSQIVQAAGHAGFSEIKFAVITK